MPIQSRGICCFVRPLYTRRLTAWVVPKDSSTETVRMMARADHIYLFYAACLNLVLGLWGLANQKQNQPILLQWSSCALLATSSLFPAISFFTQTMGSLEERTLMLPGLYLLIASMLCLILAVYKERNYITAKTWISRKVALPFERLKPKGKGWSINGFS